MAKKKATKAAAEKKAPTKSQVFADIAEDTGLTKKQVASVFDALSAQIEKNLKPRGPQAFTIPGLAKIVVKKKPRVPAGPRRNPFTGEVKQMPAKPASNTVKLRPLKNLKDMV